MVCPICTNKPANCDCSPEARELYNLREELEEKGFYANTENIIKLGNQIDAQQERRELFQKVALKLLPEADIKSDYKDIMQKAKGFTEKLLQASQKFAEQQPRKLELTK